jgi:hypothetical protein
VSPRSPRQCPSAQWARVLRLLGPNAQAHLLPEAGATQERTLEAVRCSALFGTALAKS